MTDVVSGRSARLAGLPARAGRLSVRHTTAADLAACTRFESDRTAAHWLGVKGLDWHERALADPDQEHLYAEAGGESAGFVVLAGLAFGGGHVELRRIVLAPGFQGFGLGRELFRAAVDRAFEAHGADRVWLDVRPHNFRARSLYLSEGFTANGMIPGPPEDPDELLLMVRDRA
ncbi:GNAT family N-acetyltransferase [Streptomyces sp. FH025]|uniref:GNAT family N-acetyltransferase n=1 Tax=Streptomyces sp. FH025 TaxID=2815937 RepID=UPI001A9EE52E|nr:GNAT family N-acetyltransferase [Streptomyces sp. FH025]MBO1413064.1 GNAT family N-acetyltransferase [Streptomyces sp. FH025]